jgi:hypothetical protein
MDRKEWMRTRNSSRPCVLVYGPYLCKNGPYFDRKGCPCPLPTGSPSRGSEKEVRIQAQAKHRATAVPLAFPGRKFPGVPDRTPAEVEEEEATGTTWGGRDGQPLPEQAANPVVDPGLGSLAVDLSCITNKRESNPSD